MATTARSRSTRDRPAKTPLSEQAIVDAGLEICRAEGLDAVTMRRVAAALDTGAASLYVYVRNRDELVDAMVNRAFGEIQLVVPDPAHWREQLFGMLDHFRAVLEAHPGMATMLVGVPTAGGDGPAGGAVDDNGFAWMENLLALLQAGEIDRQGAAWATDVLMLIVAATATEADIRRAAGYITRDDFAHAVQHLHATFSALPVHRFPLIVAHADELVTGDGDDRFRFAIETFLDGLVARAARVRAAQRA
jgi:AcrR family transcriptional regulator